MRHKQCRSRTNGQLFSVELNISIKLIPALFRSIKVDFPAAGLCRREDEYDAKDFKLVGKDFYVLTTRSLL